MDTIVPRWIAQNMKMCSSRLQKNDKLLWGGKSKEDFKDKHFKHKHKTNEKLNEISCLKIEMEKDGSVDDIQIKK